MIKIYCLIAAFALFWAYLIPMVIIYGWPQSISATFYSLPKRINWLFTVWLWALSILLMIAGSTNLMFLAAGFIMFVGVYPYFTEQKWQHYICAMLGILIGLASLYFDYNEWWLLILAATFVVFAYLAKIKYIDLWLEVAAFVIIMTGIAQFLGV
jgi:hypothetical protein